MGKYYGKIGFGVQEQISPGVWETKIVERTVYGDSIKNTKREVSNEHLNGGITVSNKISVLADPYMMQNFHQIKYATYMGTSWTVTSVDEEYPRLVLTLGGIYNE